MKIENASFSIFEIKRAKRDKIFDFLKDRFSVMSGPMHMIFGVFSGINPLSVNDEYTRIAVTFEIRY